MMSFHCFVTRPLALAFIFASCSTERTSAIAALDFLPYRVKLVDGFHQLLKLRFLLVHVELLVSFLSFLPWTLKHCLDVDSVEESAELILGLTACVTCV